MPSSSPRKILLTGAAGRIGKAAADALLARGHFVRALDRVPSPHASESIVADIRDPVAVTQAAAGMDQIIHLAATPDDADFMTELLPNNIVPIHHILEAARINQIKRVILASSGQVNWHQQFKGPYPVRVTDPLDPRYWYACTKVFAEFAGKSYSQTHCMDVVATRLAACPRDQQAIDFLNASKFNADLYLSPTDAGRFFVSVVEHPGGFGFQVVFVTSQWTGQEILDLEPARRLFGFQPRDRWPEGLSLDLAHP